MGVTNVTFHQGIAGSGFGDVIRKPPVSPLSACVTFDEYGMRYSQCETRV